MLIFVNKLVLRRSTVLASEDHEPSPRCSSTMKVTGFTLETMKVTAQSSTFSLGIASDVTGTSSYSDTEDLGSAHGRIPCNLTNTWRTWQLYAKAILLWWHSKMEWLCTLWAGTRCFLIDVSVRSAQIVFEKSSVNIGWFGGVKIHHLNLLLERSPLNKDTDDVYWSISGVKVRKVVCYNQYG